MPNPYLNAKLYVDPTNSATQHANSIRSTNPARAEMFDKIGNNPVAMWAGDWIAAGTEAAWVDARMDKAVAQGELATFVIYNIPIRDGGGFSGGGAASWPEYHDWLARVISGFAGRHAVIIYEPDALGHLGDMTEPTRGERVTGMTKAILDLKNAGLTVYIDAVHDNWHPAATVASMLLEIKAGNARGIALNVSNFRATAGLETFGDSVISGTGLPLTMVIDTSRNGNGPDPAGDPFNPPGRALGYKPSTTSANANVDAYIWVKSPGESDGDDGSYQTPEGEVGDVATGTIAPPAGDFWPNYAYGLAKRATWTSSAPKADTISFNDWTNDTLFSKSTDVTVSGGNLVVPTTSAYSMAFSATNYDLTASYFGAALITPPNVGLGSTQAHIRVFLDDNNYIIYGWQNGILRSERKVAAVSTYVNGPAFDAVAHKFIRLREAAGTTYYEGSADGTTWANVMPSVANPFALTSLQLGIQSGYWDAETAPGTSTWGGVNNYPSGVSTATTVSNSITLSALTASTQYEVRVRARNSVGSSAFTAWTPFTTNSSNTTIDFATVRSNSQLSDLSFGSCISTYSGDGEGVNIIKGTLEQSTDWKNKLGSIGSAGWRIPLAWNGGTPGSSAGGARTNGDAGAYVQAIKDIGGIPIVAVGGTTGDNDILAADAANLVHYFNDNGGQNGGPVTNWIIGNEPDNDGTGINGYINGTKATDGVTVTGSGFNAVADAMRAATTLTLTIAGPALVTYADYKEADYTAFFDACGAKVDVIDFHMYDGNNLARYTAAMNWFLPQIASRPSMANRVKVHCGEYNWHPSYDAASTTHNSSHFYTSRNTVAGAISTGRVVEQGGRAYQYSDNNGPLGMITPGNGLNGAPLGFRLPMPALYGVKMWSGGNLFRKATGSMATCSTSLTGVEVFASTGNKNIVIVNKSETDAKEIVISLVGVLDSDVYTIWQTVKGLDPADTAGPQWKDPVKLVSGTYVGGKISFSAPALTVSTIVVGA